VHIQRGAISFIALLRCSTASMMRTFWRNALLALLLLCGTDTTSAFKNFGHGSALSLLSPATCFPPARIMRKRGVSLITAVKGAGETIAENRESGFEYEFVERYQAGIELIGTEVKSCRSGNVQLSDGLAEVRDGELWLLNVHISPHNRASMSTQHPPKRARRLLLKRTEILRLEQRMLQRNLEVIPIKMFFSDKNFVKLELGVGSKKSLQDKRDDVIKRDGEREIRRVMKGGYD